MAAITKEWLEGELLHLRNEKARVQEFLIRVDQHIAAFEQIMTRLDAPDEAAQAEAAADAAFKEVFAKPGASGD